MDMRSRMLKRERKMERGESLDNFCGQKFSQTLSKNFD
jgi:hypothetical protein